MPTDKKTAELWTSLQNKSKEELKLLSRSHDTMLNLLITSFLFGSDSYEETLKKLKTEISISIKTNRDFKKTKERQEKIIMKR